MTRPSWTVLAATVAVGCADPAPSVQVVRPVRQPDDAPAERSWRPATPAPFSAALPLLLLDGTVMVQELDTVNWWRLTPDIDGSYATGQWSRRAPSPNGYAPLYSATSVLNDGKVIVEGGEYIFGGQAFSTQGALYDPVTDSWLPVAPPIGWQTIGDAEGIVFPDGRFMLSDCCTTNLAIFDERSLTWSDIGGGKMDINDEESWALLPDGTILTVDANNVANPMMSEIFTPSTGQWSPAGNTLVQLADLDPDGSGSHEIGPEILRVDGTVLAMGAKGQNAIYDTATKQWSQAPPLPLVSGQQVDLADGPGALLPSGDVLVAASPGVFGNPTNFFEFDGTNFNPVAAPPNAGFDSSFNNFMLLLPTGELLLTDFTGDVELYTPAHGIPDAAVPVITGIAPLLSAMPHEASTVAEEVPDDRAVELLPLTSLYLGTSYKLSGTQLDGISQGAYYGDDMQTSTNYPIVRLTNAASGHVVYCPTHDHSTRAITPKLASSTRFDVPATVERGQATIEVIANGVASPAVLVNIK